MKRLRTPLSALATLVVTSCTLAPAAHAADCSWNRPGVNPYTSSDLTKAVDDYTQIPIEVREKIKTRMRVRDYSDFVLIKRDYITGKSQYEPEIRSMHFGASSICDTVDRSKWDERMTESALVYTEGGFSVAVPIVCRNVSLIRLKGAKPPVSAVPDSGVSGGGATPISGPLAYPGYPGSQNSFAALSGPQTGLPGVVWPTYWHPRPEFRPLPPEPVDPGPIPAVPEAPSWLMTLAGLFVLFSLKRHLDT